MSYICRKHTDMKVNRSSHSNLRFLYGSVFFFAMLVLTMVLFTYYAMNEATKKMESQIFAYTISFADSAEDTACDLIFGDSLIYSSPNVAPGEQVVVNRRTLRDTINTDGKRSINEKVLFSSESLLHAIDRSTGDTLTIKPGNNSKVSISFFNGKMKAWLSE